MIGVLFGGTIRRMGVKFDEHQIEDRPVEITDRTRCIETWNGDSRHPYRSAPRPACMVENMFRSSESDHRRGSEAYPGFAPSALPFVPESAP